MSETNPVTKVAQNLSAIIDLTASLEAQAVNKANSMIDGTSLPGGLAMVDLGPEAVPDEWAEQIAAAELRHLAECPRGNHRGDKAAGIPPCVVVGAEHVEDEDPEWEPPLQTMLFWSESWRGEHGYPVPRRPTIATETNFIRWALDWAWDNEIQWADFEADVRQVRRRLEDTLHAGIRVERGAPCMYPDCKGARLVRKIDNRGERSDWRCPRCQREWDDDRYAQMVTAAHEASKFEDIDGDTWCSIEYAQRKTGRSVKTIRTWIGRGELDTVCIIAGKRLKFVRLDQVRERHEAAKRPRGRAA